MYWYVREGTIGCSNNLSTLYSFTYPDFDYNIAGINPIRAEIFGCNVVLGEVFSTSP